MKYYPKKFRFKTSSSLKGFSAVELLITLFVAAVFLISGYQLYAVVIKDGGEAKAQSKISNVMSDYLQRYKSNASNPCTKQKPITDLPISVPGLSNTTISVSIECPILTSSLGSVKSVSKITTTIKYGYPQQTITRTTYSNPQNIIFDGLVLDLDAGNKNSYSGVGTVWKDLSGKNNNAYISGEVSYTGDGGGAMVFDGSTGFATVANNSSLDFSSAQTLIIVMKHTFTSGRRNPWNQAYGGYGTWTHEQGDYIHQYFGDAGTDNSPYISTTSDTTPRNTWNIMCASRDTLSTKWYRNAVKSNTTSHSYGTLTSTAANILIGRGYAGYWQGEMAVVLAYNRALSDSEVLWNYNALRGRFGL